MKQAGIPPPCASFIVPFLHSCYASLPRTLVPRWSVHQLDQGERVQ